MTLTPQDLFVNLLTGEIFTSGKESRNTINDLGSKLAAQILLSDTSKRIIVPSKEEWIGINCLERDDELPNRRK